MKRRAFALAATSALVFGAGCSKLASRGETSSRTADEPGAPAAAATLADAAPLAASGAAAPVPPGPTVARVIGAGGPAAWDAIAARATLGTFPSLYLHQSVGQDLEDGAAAVGRPFGYYGPQEAAGSVAPGLHGGLFADVGPVDNGKPLAKMGVVRRELRKQKGKLRVLAFSFGYADVLDTLEEDGRTVTLAEVVAEYTKLVAEAKAAGVRFVHVTPPLVFDPATNPPKMKLRETMLRTFAGDVIFDLQDVESLDAGKRCEVGGVWRICEANRSTAACPSKGQGVDGDGQGHLCEKKAAVFAKGLLLAIETAGR